jgi:hypothetical protein
VTSSPALARGSAGVMVLRVWTGEPSIGAGLTSTFRGFNYIADPTMTDAIRSLIKLGEYVVFECFEFIDPISRSHPKFQIVSDNIKWSKFGKESGGVDYENDPVAPVMFPGAFLRVF